MRVQLAPKLIKKIKKQNVRLRKSFKISINIFSKDPNDLHLNNHELRREWKGFSSIDVTSDLRAIYQEIDDEDGTFAYFVELGTHDRLFRKHKNLLDS